MLVFKNYNVLRSIQIPYLTEISTLSSKNSTYILYNSFKYLNVQWSLSNIDNCLSIIVCQNKNEFSSLVNSVLFKIPESAVFDSKFAIWHIRCVFSENATHRNDWSHKVKTIILQFPLSPERKISQFSKKKICVTLKKKTTKKQF